ncbi:LysR family transcriptional regulator [Shumkonia mesophila]|uniref:LysR family transcriptional regulator n=1 Tax=Shumkonia mesophila TaxID=2838854 RepID=UPI002935309C|nr:LysR substrate-binding domain-containing protein [Shumkonia mesophila]
MDGRGLRYFVEVVRQGGFTRAARVLNVTQPTISKMIRQLEENLAASLLVRSPRGIQLTDAGRIVYERATQILRDMNEMKAEVDALKGMVRGSLRLGLPPTAGASFFPGVLAEFRRRFPDVRLSVFEHGCKQVTELILAGDLDVGITLMPFDDRQFDGLPFAEDTLVLVAPRTGKWSRHDAVGLAELATEPFVMLTEEFLTAVLVREACRAAGFTPTEAAHSGQWDFLVTMVEAGLGVTLLPASMCQALKPHGVAMVPLKPEIRYQVALVWPRAGYPSFAARAWVRLTRDILGPPQPPVVP